LPAPARQPGKFGSVSNGILTCALHGLALRTRHGSLPDRGWAPHSATRISDPAAATTSG
jgi:hypothetical protein